MEWYIDPVLITNLFTLSVIFSLGYYLTRLILQIRKQNKERKRYLSDLKNGDTIYLKPGYQKAYVITNLTYIGKVWVTVNGQFEKTDTMYIADETEIKHLDRD